MIFQNTIRKEIIQLNKQTRNTKEKITKHNKTTQNKTKTYIKKKD